MVDHGDLDRPNGARIYDYELGGSHNTAADRAVAEKIRAVAPHSAWVARSNRAFLHRAVRFCLARGINQFLDLGSGIPTVGNVHEVAHELHPDARVVYVDNEPVAVAHTRRLLADDPGTDIVDGDLRHPEQVMSAPPTVRLLESQQPIALLLVAALHYVDVVTNPAAVLRSYTAALPPRSLLVFSQTTADGRETEAAEVRRVFDEETTSPITLRSRDEIAKLLADGGWTLLPPGLVRPPEWHPDPADPAEGTLVQSGSWAGIAHRFDDEPPR